MNIKNSPDFYKELGVKGLESRKDAFQTRSELSYIKKLINKKQKILDLACGYGRFTLPLAKQGYAVEGLDISPNFISEARKRAKAKGLKIKFRSGDMRKLPYKDLEFDVILCMWSAFIELPKKKDQIKALREMYRVLNKKGFALLEMPIGKRIKRRAEIYMIDNIKSSPMCKQNTQTMKKLMKRIGPSRYKVFMDNFGGRKRLLVMFSK